MIPPPAPAAAPPPPQALEELVAGADRSALVQLIAALTTRPYERRFAGHRLRGLVAEGGR